jgi:hypothetical protein
MADTKNHPGLLYFIVKFRGNQQLDFAFLGLRPYSMAVCRQAARTGQSRESGTIMRTGVLAVWPSVEKGRLMKRGRLWKRKNIHSRVSSC